MCMVEEACLINGAKKKEEEEEKEVRESGASYVLHDHMSYDHMIITRFHQFPLPKDFTTF